MKRLVLVWLAARLALLALTGLNGHLPYVDGAQWEGEGAGGRRYRFVDQGVLDAHVRWDGKAYLHIAWLGYDDARGVRSNTAFFAGYAWMVRGFHAVFARSWMGEERAATRTVWTLCGILVNAATFLGALFLLRGWVLARGGDAALADRTGLLLIASPVSFVFHCTHSESAFLFFALLACRLVERGRDLGGFLAGAAAAAVRLFGVFLAPVLLWLAWLRRGRSIRALGPVWCLPVLVPLGAGLVLLRMAEINGHLDAYFHQQREFFGHESFPDPAGALDLLRVTGKGSWWVARDLVQALAAALAFVGLVLFWRQERGREDRGPYALFTLLLVAVPLLSGEVISMPRYVSVAFPLWLAAARVLGGGPRFAVALALGAAGQVLGWLGWMHGWPLFV